MVRSCLFSGHRPGFVISVSFLVRAERADRLLSRSFSLKSLRVLVGDLEIASLPCPVHALRIYLEGLRVVRLGVLTCLCPQVVLFAPSLRTLFLSFLREIIFGAGAVSGVGVPPLRVLSIRDMSSSLSFYLFC